MPGDRHLLGRQVPLGYICVLGEGRTLGVVVRGIVWPGFKGVNRPSPRCQRQAEGHACHCEHQAERGSVVCSNPRMKHRAQLMNNIGSLGMSVQVDVRVFGTPVVSRSVCIALLSNQRTNLYSSEVERSQSWASSCDWWHVSHTP